MDTDSTFKQRAVTVAVEINSSDNGFDAPKAITLRAYSNDPDACWADIRAALQNFLKDLEYGL